MVAVAPGRRLGAYELGEPVGHGGSAVVYRAYDTVHRREVAVKVIAGPHAADATFRARFRQEAEVVARLDHPHILRVLDAGEATEPASLLGFGSLLYLVTDYMAGGSLASRLGTGSSLRERALLATKVATQVGAALDWAHAAGVLHRDVKPSNILIAADGRLVLGDFGLARVLQQGASLHLTATGLVAGTPAYMAPEQALGGPADARSDLYGLGVVLFEILAGRIPFEAETPMAVLLAQVHQPPPRLADFVPEIAAPLEAVLLRALAKDPDARYQTGAALAAAVRGAVASVYGESVISTGAWTAVGDPPRKPASSGRCVPSARPASGSRRTPRWPRRHHPGLVAVAAVALSTLLLAGGSTAAVLGPARPVVATLLERFLVDSTPPGISEAWPRNNQRVGSLRPQLAVRFDHPMDQASVEAALHLTPPVALDLEWVEGQLLVITPQVDLAPGQEYVLEIDTSARDVEGRPLGGKLVRRFVTMAIAPQPNVAVAAPAATGERPEPQPEPRPELSPTAAQRPAAQASPPPSLPSSTPTVRALPTVPRLEPNQEMVAGLVQEAGGAPHAPGDDSGQVEVEPIVPALPPVGTVPASGTPAGASGTEAASNVYLSNVPIQEASAAPGATSSATATVTGGQVTATPRSSPTPRPSPTATFARPVAAIASSTASPTSAPSTPGSHATASATLPASAGAGTPTPAGTSGPTSTPGTTVPTGTPATAAGTPQNQPATPLPSPGSGTSTATPATTPAPPPSGGS